MLETFEVDKITHTQTHPEDIFKRELFGLVPQAIKLIHPHMKHQCKQNKLQKY